MEQPDRATAHVVACGSCTATLALMRAIDGVARELPAPDPEEARVAAIERRLMLAPERRSRTAWAAVAAAIVAASLVGLAAGRLLAPSPSRLASIRASAGARHEYLQVLSAPDRVERVTLEEGSVALEVQPLAPGQRFLVVTHDAEVEVRGTSFEVDAEAGLLRAVRVRSGKVQVRPAVGESVLLGPGQSWEPPPPEPPPVPAVVAAAPPKEVSTQVARQPRRPEPEAPAPIAPAPEPSPVAAPGAVEAIEAERAFASAWAALREGHHSLAAERMAAARDADPSGPLAEDARYWRIVALQRAGRDRLAAFEATTFLHDLPGSSRFGEVAVLAGVLELDQGSNEAASRYFSLALQDANAEIRKKAAAGLAAAKAPRAP